MATKFIESGSAATQDMTFWGIGAITSGTGAVTSDAQAVSTSVRSIKCASGATSGVAVVGQRGVLADAGRRISIYLRFTGTPNPGGTGGSDFLGVETSGDLAVFAVSLNASKQLVLTGNGSSALATGSTVLNTSQDYRILVVYTITSTTVNSIKIYINGVLEITATNVTLPNTGSDTLYLGWGALNSAGNNMVGFFAHVFVDDGTTGDPGDIHVTAKRPNANGTTNGYTTQIGVGGSGYGTGHSPQVNERPLSITNGWSMIGAGSAITEEYNIENLSTGDIDLTGTTIIDYMGWVYSKALASETASIIVNNVSSNISLTSTTTMFKQIAGSASYPAGAGKDIGEITSTTLTTVSLYECGIIVAYTPAVTSTPQGGYMTTSGFFG